MVTAIRPNPMPEWCGAGLCNPVIDEDGNIVSELRRMCGLKEPHDWHQDRFDSSIRWKSLPPFLEREIDTVPQEWVDAANMFLLAAVQEAFTPESRKACVWQARACLRGDEDALREAKGE